jgi:integrase/recombinase XerC
VPLFASARGEPLTRRGILKMVKRHVASAAATMPSLGKKSVAAHSLRLAAALHLLCAGNDISTVRRWLGHGSVATTDHYTEIDAEMKRQALETEAPVPPKRVPSWKRGEGPSRLAGEALI